MEEVTQEAHRIAELVEQADSRAAAPSATEEAEKLRAGARPNITDVGDDFCVAQCFAGHCDDFC